MTRYSKILAVFALLTAPWGGARGACQLPPASASLGQLTSFAVNNSVDSTTGNINVNCGAGNTLALLSSNYIQLQLTGAAQTNGARAVLQLNNGTDGIPVQLCTDANCANELQINGTPKKYASGDLVNLIGLLGGLNFSIPLYIRTVTGQTVAAGMYTGTLNVLTSYAICTGIGAVGQCAPGGMQTGSAVVPLNITLMVTNDCTTITAPAINFGSASLISGLNPVSQAITVICTKGSSYSVGLNNGGNAVNNLRYMANSGQLIGYEVFKGDSNDRWGDSGGDRWSSGVSSSVSSDGTLRTYRYVARIAPSQPTPPPGAYTDTLVVDLSF